MLNVLIAKIPSRRLESVGAEAFEDDFCSVRGAIGLGELLKLRGDAVVLNVEGTVAEVGKVFNWISVKSTIPQSTVGHAGLPVLDRGAILIVEPDLEADRELSLDQTHHFFEGEAGLSHADLKVEVVVHEAVVEERDAAYSSVMKAELSEDLAGFFVAQEKRAQVASASYVEVVEFFFFRTRGGGVHVVAP